MNKKEQEIEMLKRLSLILKELQNSKTIRDISEKTGIPTSTIQKYLNKKEYNIIKCNKNNFQRSLQMERVDSKTNSRKFNQEETLKMILGIQTIILKYIKNNT